MSDKVEFLTQKQIDSVKIISVLQQESTLSPFDKDILEKITDEDCRYLGYSDL